MVKQKLVRATQHIPINRPPMRRGPWKETSFDTGVIVGQRTITHGEVNEGEYGSVDYRPIPGTARRVWLVAFDLHMSPVMCMDSQIRPAI